ncbi:MAG: OmpA family protein [Candidatus Coatesbacteria bacterium]|jgi:outer membrane protein OmpA-like peptidoglycan-associated protein|nr:OmpA family protein [Candidatus Coatesbacteria bacterium]
MKKFLVLATLLVVLVGMAAAEGTHPYGMAGMFKTWRANTIQQWGLSLGLHFDVWSYRRELAGSSYEYAEVDISDPIDEIWSRNPFQLTLCFLDAWELSVAPSFGAHKVFDTEIEVLDMSELFIGTKVNFIFEEENGYLPAMAIMINADIGDMGINTHYDFRPKDVENDYTLDFIYALSKHVGRDDIFSYALNLGYRLTLADLGVYEYAFDEAEGETTETKVGTVAAPDYFIYGVGFEVKPTDNFAFITDFNGRISFGDEVERYGESEEISDTWFQIIPGIRLSGDDFLYWDFAVPIGVGPDNPWIEVITGFSADIDLVPRDSDGDGIPDEDDVCPKQPEDYDGFEDADGCPDLDNDEDGIPDTEDRCPDEPEDKDGFEDADGCPDPDNDGDGIPDEDDDCPNEPETVNGYQDEDGCPDEKPVEPVYEGPKTIRLDEINFEPNTAVMRPGYRSSLDQAAEILKEYPSLTVTISGHTTDRGERGFLMELSRDRAQAVVDALVNDYGIDRGRLTAVGHGPDKPVASNSTSSGRAQNRRIEFEVND